MNCQCDAGMRTVWGAGIAVRACGPPLACAVRRVCKVHGV